MFTLLISLASMGFEPTSADEYELDEITTAHTKFRRHWTDIQTTGCLNQIAGFIMQHRGFFNRSSIHKLLLDPMDHQPQKASLFASILRKSSTKRCRICLFFHWIKMGILRNFRLPPTEIAFLYYMMFS